MKRDGTPSAVAVGDHPHNPQASSTFQLKVLGKPRCIALPHALEMTFKTRLDRIGRGAAVLMGRSSVDFRRMRCIPHRGPAVIMYGLDTGNDDADLLLH